MKSGSIFRLRIRNLLISALYIASSITLCFSTTIAAALEDADLDKFSANNIMFYDPDGDKCTIKPVSGSNITYIGDSLSEQVYSNMQNAYPGIDGDDKNYDGTTYNLIKYSKTFSGNDSGPNHGGIALVKKLAEKKDLRSYLIFALGTNSPGGVTETTLNELVSAAGEDTKILLVTNYRRFDDSLYVQNNDAMSNFASSHSNVAVADWYTTASSDPDKYIRSLSEDSLGVHLTTDGVTAFVDTLKTAITSAWGSSSGGGGGDSGSSGNNKNYDGVDVWTEGELEKIEENKAVYQAAADKYGIKWQLLATVHSAEYSLQVANPSNGQGMYQLFSYTNGGRNENAFLPAGDVDEAEFARQTDIAASEIVKMIEMTGAALDSDEGAKEVLFQYNGKAGVYIQKAKDMGFTDEEANRGEGSAYVMNRYDARRDPAHPETMDSHWPGRFVADGVYDPSSTSMGFGTFVKYAAIGGTSGSSCSVQQGDLIGYVKRYAWPEHHDAPYHDRMPDYATAVSDRQSKGLYVGGSVAGVPGIDCGGFVTTVLNDSGFAPEYNYSGDTTKGASNVTYGQIPYVKANPDKWELVNPDWNTAIPDESVLTPGDVAYSNCNDTPFDDCGHTYLYIGEVDGFETHIASASYSTHGAGRAPMSGTEAIISGSTGIVRWVHRK